MRQTTRQHKCHDQDNKRYSPASVSELSDRLQNNVFIATLNKNRL